MIIPLTNLVAEGSTDMRWLTATQPHGANLVVASSASSHPAALRTARESYRWLLAEGLLDATWLYQALHVLVQARLELLNMHGLVDWQPAGRRLDADLGGILRLLVGRAPRGGGGWGGGLLLCRSPGGKGTRAATTASHGPRRRRCRFRCSCSINCIRLLAGRRRRRRRIRCSPCRLTCGNWRWCRRSGRARAA